MAKMPSLRFRVRTPVRAGRARHPEPPDGWVRIKVPACGICHSDSQVDGRKMMARRNVYGLFPGVAILLAVGAALGQGMQTLTNEQAARRHCPADTVVWLNTSSANYQL